MADPPSDDALESTLLAGFASDPTATPHLDTALAHFCAAAPGALRVRGVSIWLFDRRASEFRLAATTADTAPETRIPRDDPSSPVARALHTPDTLWTDPDPALAAYVPLRGRRRALGVLAVEPADALGADGARLFVQIERLARRLAAAIEQLQLLDEVVRSRRELEQTFNALSDLVAVCDRSLVIAQINEAFGTHVNARGAAAIGRPLRAFLGDDTVAWIERAGAEVMDTGRVVHQDLVDTRLGGTFSLTLSRRSGADGRPVGLVVLARDITEQRRLESERTRLNERLVHTEKLASLGQFVAGIAHELNNPLQGILGHVDLLVASRALPPQATRDLRMIGREAERAARIIRDLLVFARAGTPTARRPVRISTILARVLAVRARALKTAGIEVARALPVALPRVAGVPVLLQQAFLNIVLNAEQAMAGVARRRLEVQVSTTADGSRIQVVVRDTGPGIREEDLPRVFEPFFTTKSVGQGTGLGLALTYGILQDHGGEIVVANHHLGGAEFTVYLPLFRPAPGVRSE